jgi:hypothetical protein
MYRREKVGREDRKKPVLSKKEKKQKKLEKKHKKQTGVL